ncbi:hypothetical protein LX69_00638 [Breznakibacter xylanolyticus]|uniref:Uncharacterized protein n=1 Tax=Breznakibacter xylanolyticus TaxID=990 RepID=A0A2W7NG45_9BACT|nr:hypothetical protein [Breznakibacter xylanolyticus]PZX19371.1 hypothetical protein LX69_00638 [Breznakibacter xylanolyticus]
MKKSNCKNNDMPASLLIVDRLIEKNGEKSLAVHQSITQKGIFDPQSNKRKENICALMIKLYFCDSIIGKAQRDEVFYLTNSQSSHYSRGQNLRKVRLVCRFR